MKRLIAVMLTLCMLLGSAAYAEEALVEKAFMSGLETLLNSVDPSRDMLTLSADYLGNAVFNATLKQQDQMADIALDVADNHLQAQVSDTDITVAVGDTVMNLQFADVEKMINSFTESLSGQVVHLQTLEELAQLLLEKVIMPDLQIDETEGLHITYFAAGETLLAHLADFGDAVLTNEKYDAFLEQVLQIIGMTGQKLPTLSELKESWPGYKAMLSAMKTDFEAAFELKLTDERLDVTAHIGDSSETYALTLAAWGKEGQLNLEGFASETRQGREKTYESEITFKGNLTGTPENNTWSFEAHNPGMAAPAGMAPIGAFDLIADGSMADQAGTIHISSGILNDPRRQYVSFMLFMNYSLTDEGLTAMAYILPGPTLRRIAPRLMTSLIADVLISERQCSISLSTTSGQKLFGLKLLADDKGQLQQAYGEFFELNSRQKYTALYDGEKLVITANGVTVTCTGAFESDHAYVITLHAEGENVAPGQEDAFIRFEYEGEKGNFNITGKVIGPDGTEGIKAELTCKPTEPIDSLLREQEGVMFLTPETIQTLLTQMLGLSE